MSPIALEDRTAVTELLEFMHVSDIGADVDKLKSAVSFDLFFYIAAVGTAGHSVNSDHMRFLLVSFLISF